MKKAFSIFAALLIAISAAAQTPTTTTPQSVTNASVFSGVSTAQASGCLANEGQTVHFIFYSAGGATGNPTGVQIRLEASYNSDPATCSTGTWFPISDDGTDTGQNGTNLVFAIGTFPFVRLNLVKCGGCDGNDTISASYTGTSSIPGNPFGSYGTGQQVRKVVFLNQASGGNVNSSRFVTPYASTAGFILLRASNTFTAGILSARCQDTGGAINVNSFTIPAAGTTFVIPIPATACVSVDVRCQGCATTGAVAYSANWYFFPPGGALPYGGQPANTNNQETSAVNATASVALTPAALQRAHVFSVSARCSAGTAGITVVDTTTSTTLWTSAAAEVGVTTFKFQWNPGLAGAPGDTITISLTTCGGANTGTLDVQGSTF